nr:MAG TPA: hypothetical protein [Bacteriophage sp.]
MLRVGRLSFLLLWNGFPDNAGRILRVFGCGLYQFRQGFKVRC